MGSEITDSTRHTIAYAQALEQHGTALGLSHAIIQKAAASPLAGPLAALWETLAGHPDTEAVLARLVAECERRSDGKAFANRVWDCRSQSQFISAFSALFLAWVNVVPTPNDPTTDELYWIQRIDWLFVNSPTALSLVRGARVTGQEAPSRAQRPDLGRVDLTEAFTRFLSAFNAVRAAFLESPASAAAIADWLRNPRAETEDFALQDAADYPSWNAYFTRRLRGPEDGTAPTSKPPLAGDSMRPINMRPGAPESQLPPLDARSAASDTQMAAATEGVPGVHDAPSPARPVAHPERAWLVSAPTDCIIEPLIASAQSAAGAGADLGAELGPLELHTSLAVKGQPFSVERLLGRAPDWLKGMFVGGHGYTCVLLPTGYHHFHAPVSGRVVYTEIIQGGSYGLADRSGLPSIQSGRLQEGAASELPFSTAMRAPVGAPTVESGTLNVRQFEWFTRGVVIIEVEPAFSGPNAGELKVRHIDQAPDRGLRRGWVASIPVGLNTIGSVNLADDIAPGAAVRRGDTRLGHFAYGGSLNILLFSAGLLEPGVRVRLGAQIGVMR